MESWEEHADGGDTTPPPPPPPRNNKPLGFSFNPNAPSFAFSTNAPSFQPQGFSGPLPPPPPREFSTHAQTPPPPPPREPEALPQPSKQDEPQASVSEASGSETLQADLHQSTSTNDQPSLEEPEPAPQQMVEDEAMAPADEEATAVPSNGVEEATEKLSKVTVDTVPEPEATEDEKDIIRAFEKLQAEDPRDHMNIVFIGHVDSGKSTLAGQILLTTGNVDQRTIEKYEREAKDNNREAWYMAYIMDTNEEEREKGITVEAGRAHFETPSRRYTILDAPGHKNYVPNMIVAASQADVAVLVISARKGEFEAGAERGGQTREHAQLAKTLGAVKLIVVVNKLDDHSVCCEDGTWDKKRYDQIVDGLSPFFKQCGFNLKKDVVFLPIAALYCKNLDKPLDKADCPWYDGPSLFQVLDGIELPERPPTAPFRMPIVDKMKEMGSLYLIGKSEQGFIKCGDVLQIMPNKQRVKVEQLFRDEKESTAAKAGENLRIKITGADEGDIQTGFVLSSIRNPVPVVSQFEAQIRIVEVLDHLKVFTVGYKSILHIHTVTEECEMVKLLAEIDPKTGEEKKCKFIKANGIAKIRIQVEKPIPIEAFGDLPAMGRFTLRDEGRTIAIGKVTKLPKVH